MKYYAGLDVSMKETFVCIVDNNGKILVEGKTSTEPTAIAQYLNKVGVSLEKVALESGSLSHWLVTELQSQNVPVICIDSRHMSSMLAMNVNKTDTNDARGIANALRGGYVREVNIKSQYHVEVNILLQSRSILVQERTKLKNAIRGLIKTFGLKIATTGMTSFIKGVRKALQEVPSDVKLAIEGLLKAIESISEQIEGYEEQIEQIASEDQAAQLLMTIPGVGMLTALYFVTTLGDYSRFKNSRDVAAYLGLTPRQYSSGDVQRLGRISKCGSREARSMLVEAATVMLTRTKSWCRPKAWAMKLQRKKGFKKAAVALGRKLAVIMHRMLVSRKPFHYGEEPKKGSKKVLEKVA